MVAMWQIWLARNVEMIPMNLEPTLVTKLKIWHEVKVILRFEWEKCKKQGMKDAMTEDR